MRESMRSDEGTSEKKKMGRKKNREIKKNRKKNVFFFLWPSSTIHGCYILSSHFFLFNWSASRGRGPRATRPFLWWGYVKKWPRPDQQFFGKKKFFENCFLSMVSAPICIYRNLFTSIHNEDTGSELFGFTVYSIGNENSFCFKKRVFLSLFYWKITPKGSTREEKKMKNIAKINSLPSSCIFFYAEWTHDLRAPPIYHHRGHLKKKSREKKSRERNRKKIGKKS